MKLIAIILLFDILLCDKLSAQFHDDFDGASLPLDPEAINGWTFRAGDGSATMDFQQQDGHAAILVDATNDQRNIWWALIRRCVSAEMDLNQLRDPNYELRIAARIRVSHAPRRVNLHLNTQRTTDFHSHLMEFDIPDTVNWHTISMITRDFDANPGDRIYGQLALMDWGHERYRVDLDYFKVDIVNVDSIGPDEGVQVPYHPAVPAVATFAHHIPVAHDAMVDLEYPDRTFGSWSTRDEGGKTVLLTVSGTQFVILRWDLSAFAGKRVSGSGLLELTTQSLQRSLDDVKDFGMVRVVEIVGGNADWQEEDVTYHELCQGLALNQVLNSQMVIDIDVAPGRGGKNLITLSNPVLQRLLDGKTPGLALRPLGAVIAAFYANGNRDENISPRLHFNIKPN